MHILKALSLLAIALAAILSCNTNPENHSAAAPDVPLATLRLAPETVSIDAVDYRADIFPWRDFMPGPGNPENGSGLLAVAKICRTDSLAISEELHLKFLWVIYDNNVWSATLGEERSLYGAEFCREAVARGGPKWGPSVDVQAVIGFVDETGELNMLRTPPTTILRTD